MTVLVVGKGGTLGAAIAQRLHAEALELRAPDPRDDGPVSELRGATVVVNAGGPRVRKGLDFADYFREHVGVATRVVRSMAPGSHVVHLSSTAVFGAQSGRLGIDSVAAPTLFPSAAYACAKLAAEAQLRVLARERGIHVTVLRPSMVYGPGIDSALESIRRLSRRGIALRLLPERARQHLVHADLFLDAVERAASTLPHEGERSLVLADPFILQNRDLVPERGVPVPLPLEAAAVARRVLDALDVGPTLSLEALAVLAIDNEFDWKTSFDELGLEPERYARDRTFDPYFRDTKQVAA